MSGVNRTPAALPFQVSSGSVTKPDIPLPGTPSSSREYATPPGADRSIPNRPESSRPEGPPFVSTFTERRTELSGIARPDGTRDLRRDGQRLTETIPKDYNPKIINIPKKSLRLSDL